MSFDKRLALALAHERHVIRLLRRRGWQAEPFGQGQLSAPMRELLRTVPTPVRFMPDIIAARTVIRFIDAKAGEKYRETGRHAIQRAALDAAEVWEQMAASETFFVFHDGGVLTPAEVRAHCVPGVNRGQGSGTPFVLIDATRCRPLDSVFGKSA